MAKYLLDDLKEGGIKKFKTTFQGQDASNSPLIYRTSCGTTDSHNQVLKRT